MLLSPRQLSALLNAGKSVSILDATWFMPNSPRNAFKEFQAKRIPGAQFLDLDVVASPHQLNLKHMMPTGRVFADACENMGIGPSSQVVIYDSHGVFSSPRALFMFRSFGHINSSILDGGLPRWEHEQFPLETGPAKTYAPSSYPTPSLDESAIKNYDDMVTNSFLVPFTTPDVYAVLDARPAGRFSGKDPEPRPGLSSGHIPNSSSLPFSCFLESRDTPDGNKYTALKPIDGLRQALTDVLGETNASLVTNGKTPVVTTCGSGMTAAVLWLGLKQLGVNKVGLYDESWTGYAMRQESKIQVTI